MPLPVPPARIAALSARMRLAPSRQALAAIIAEEIATYSLHDLQELRASVERDMRHVPGYYRKKLQPKIMEHLFGTYHVIMVGHRKGRFDGFAGPLSGRIREFCDMLLGLPEKGVDGDLRILLLYYLISAFTIFVCELPGHPVGTPFPGGFAVEEREGTYYCPVREKEDEVETSICPFCPAEQIRLPGDEPL